MGTLIAIVEQVGRTLTEWRASSVDDLVFDARNTAMLVAAMFAVVAATTVAWRSLRGRLPGRTAIALPAILPRVRRSPLTFVRHAPFLLFLAGLPFFCLALGDPYSSLSSTQVSYPGRRIAVIMDASLSMLSPFSGQQLKTQSDTAFSNTMAAAEYFIRVRMKGRYRDLIALLQFGNEAYVITPFTTDYENLLLSLKMISDVNEWQRFPDQGTIIMKAIDEGVDLFNAFDFLESSGNIMVIFSDGQDNNVQIGEMSLDQVLKKAVDNKVPVYMIRTAYARGLFDVVPDAVWKKAIDATGGRFFPAANQETIMQAIKEIDAAATGRVEAREYSVRQPRYMRFALPAVLLWTIALGLQMTLRMFRTFP
jgi:Ca-activated chloride channel family protein